MIEFGAVAAAGLGEEQVLAGEVNGFDGAALGKRVAGIADEKDSLLAQGLHTVRRVGECVAHAKGEVDLAGFQLGSVAGADVGHEGEFDFGKAASKGAEDLGQAVGEDAFGGTDAQGAAGLGAVADGALTLFHGEQSLFGEWVKAAASVSERDAAAEPVEQRDAELLFKRLDLRSDIGLHGVDALGGAGEVQLFGESAIDLELSDFHLEYPLSN